MDVTQRLVILPSIGMGSVQVFTDDWDVSWFIYCRLSSGLELASILVAYATQIKTGRVKNIIGRTRASAENIDLSRTSRILKDALNHGKPAWGKIE